MNHESTECRTCTYRLRKSGNWKNHRITEKSSLYLKVSVNNKMKLISGIKSCLPIQYEVLVDSSIVNLIIRNEDSKHFV